jgi:GNAT superfamily N-acetyltransferase
MRIVAFEILVRPARREEVQEIVSLSRTSVTDDEVAGFGTPYKSSVQEETEEMLSTWTGPNRADSLELFVAEVEGRLVGCVRIEDRGEELELVDIDVVRELQRRGIGKRMIEFVEQLARERGKKAVTLGTSRNAQGVAWKSLPWWNARGYRVTHEEENEWTRSIGTEVREIRMRKGL